VPHAFTRCIFVTICACTWPPRRSRTRTPHAPWLRRRSSTATLFRRVSSLFSRAFSRSQRSQSVLVAVIVPDADICKHWAAENQIAEGWTLASLCGDARFKAAVMEQMKSAGASAKLKGFEVVRDIHLEAEAFAVDNELLTPTFKLKRPQVQRARAPLPLPLKC
jgi:hypothetical protein